MRLTIRLFQLCLLLVPAASNAAGTEFMQGLGDVSYHHVNSEIVGRGYHIHVRLPVEYDQSDRDYPTVYLLDGGNTFPMLAPYYQYLSYGEEVPDLILVGISYGSDDVRQWQLPQHGLHGTFSRAGLLGWRDPKFQAFLARRALAGHREAAIDRTPRQADHLRAVARRAIRVFTRRTNKARPVSGGTSPPIPAMHRNLEFFPSRPRRYLPVKAGSKLFIGERHRRCATVFREACQSHGFGTGLALQSPPCRGHSRPWTSKATATCPRHRRRSGRD